MLQHLNSAAGLFLLFLIYSTLGWCGEMIYCSIGQRRLCEKRGFLNGFLCPIYGFGALLVLWALRGGCESPVLTFFFGALLTSAVEYFTSYLMEKLFHMRWWDYSRYKFQIHGRVCLLNSTLFGLLCAPLSRCALDFIPALYGQRRLVLAHGLHIFPYGRAPGVGGLCLPARLSFAGLFSQCVCSVVFHLS